MVIGAFVASQDLFGESSDDSLFTDTIQASLPLGLEEPSDLTDLTGDQKFLAYDDPGLLSDGSSILPPENPTTYSPDEFFSISSDPFVPADCFGFDSSSLSSIPIAMGRLRSKRSGQCAAPNNINNAVPSVPTVDDLDENVRETILRVYPALGDELRLSQEDDDDNSACVLLSGGVMPRGACTSATHWMYFGSGTFSWNSQYKLKLWDLWYVTPGMIQNISMLFY